MKRLLLILVASVAVLSLSGCGKGDPLCLFAEDIIGCLIVTGQVR